MKVNEGHKLYAAETLLNDLRSLLSLTGHSKFFKS